MPEALPSSTAIGPEPRRLDAGRGVDWWREAWALFMKSPGMWLLFALIFLVIDLALGMVPFIGTVAGALVLPGLIAGWMGAARKLDAGGKLEPADLFMAFQLKPRPMLMLGGLFVAATLLVLVLLAGGAGMGLTGGSGHAGSAGGLAMAVGVGGLSAVLAIVLCFLIGTLLWFAPALVLFADVEPVAALKASWTGSMRNIVPFLLYGLIYVVAAFVASLPFGLGWILLIPVGLLTAYASYKDVFGL